ncbi:MAG: hypothetical protein U5N55_10805 [Cypionkella sp.]|nr:hypothetical protein [Cypionkella sp.]
MIVKYKKLPDQGEIRIDILAEIPDCETKPFMSRGAKGWIISQSDQGNHHILGGDCEVLERVTVPSGARILYAIVREHTRLFQDAAVPHNPVDLEPGIYEFRLKREFNPFSEQARRVAD